VNGTLVIEQLPRHGDAERDGLSRSGLRRDEEIAACGFGINNRCLDGGGGFIRTGGERGRQDARNLRKWHDVP